MKAYYYQVATHSQDYRYFKANKKAQIKEYLNKSYVHFDRIFDPSKTPVEGVRYRDVTVKK